MNKDDLQIIDSCIVGVEERLQAASRIASSFEPDLCSICEVDLHCHSFFSDGYCSPAGKVFEAYRRKMKAIAISDHDVFDGQLEAVMAGKIFGMDVIPAIEFYTDRPGVEIIGHFPDVEAFILMLKSGISDSVIEPIRDAKKKQLSAMSLRIPECFEKVGFHAEITGHDIDKYVRKGISTKGDISVIMWQKYGCELRKSGIALDVKDFQAKYTTQDNMLNLPLDIDVDLSPGKFVKRILEWGGLPGLSHPTELRKKEGLDNCELRKLIEELAVSGLQTIEIDGWRNGICPETGLHQTDLFNQMRKEYNLKLKSRNLELRDNKSKRRDLELLFTNGSDDHNQPGEGLKLGCGKDCNLRPEFGRYENVKKLRRRCNTNR